MGVPTSEVGYTPAMPRREDHEVHKDMWWHWTEKNIAFMCLGWISEPTVTFLYTLLTDWFL